MLSPFFYIMSIDHIVNDFNYRKVAVFHALVQGLKKAP